MSADPEDSHERDRTRRAGEPTPTARASLRQLLHALSETGVAHRDTRRQVLDRVCGVAATRLRASGVAVTLLPSAGAHVVGASSGVTRAWEQTQFDLGGGPSSEADRAQVPVLVPDLVSDPRWPGLAGDERCGGVAAVFSIPLRLGASRFGAFTMYRARPGPLSPADLVALHELGDLVVELLIDTHPLDDHAQGDPVELTAVLHDEIDGQAIVYQAQGMVMVQLGCSLAEALARMRARAYADELTLGGLARQVVDGTAIFEKGS